MTQFTPKIGVSAFFQTSNWIDTPSIACNGGVTREKSVAMAVGYWHFLGTSTAKKHIGQEIQCLPYTEFLDSMSPVTGTTLTKKD